MLRKATLVLGLLGITYWSLHSEEKPLEAITNNPVEITASGTILLNHEIISNPPIPISSSEDSSAAEESSSAALPLPIIGNGSGEEYRILSSLGYNPNADTITRCVNLAEIALTSPTEITPQMILELQRLASSNARGRDPSLAQEMIDSYREFGDFSSSRPAQYVAEREASRSVRSGYGLSYDGSDRDLDRVSSLWLFALDNPHPDPRVIPILEEVVRYDTNSGIAGIAQSLVSALQDYGDLNTPRISSLDDYLTVLESADTEDKYWVIRFLYALNLFETMDREGVNPQILTELATIAELEPNYNISASIGPSLGAYTFLSEQGHWPNNRDFSIRRRFEQGRGERSIANDSLAADERWMQCVF